MPTKPKTFRGLAGRKITADGTNGKLELTMHTASRQYTVELLPREVAKLRDHLNATYPAE